MHEWRRDDGYSVTDDRNRIDREFVWQWLAHDTGFPRPQTPRGPYG